MSLVCMLGTPTAIQAGYELAVRLAVRLEMLISAVL